MGPGGSWGNLAVPPASTDAESPSPLIDQTRVSKRYTIFADANGCPGLSETPGKKGLYLLAS